MALTFKLIPQVSINQFQFPPSKVNCISHHGTQPEQIIGPLQAMGFLMLSQQQSKLEDTSGCTGGQQGIAILSQA